MKKELLAGIISVFIITAPFVSAQQGSWTEEMEVGVTLDYFSKYIWRGQEVTGDSVFQPGATLGFNNLTLGFWGNVDLTNINDSDYEFTETDWYVDYTADVPGSDWIDWSVGYIFYQFPHANDTSEFYWGFAFDVLFQPYFTFYHDLDEASGGTYFNVGVSHGWDNVFEIMPDVPVGMDLSLSWGAAEGDYNDAYFGVDETAANDMVVSVAFPMEMGGWEITPNLSYITLLDNKIRDAATDDEHFVVGVSCGYTF